MKKSTLLIIIFFVSCADPFSDREAVENPVKKQQEKIVVDTQQEKIVVDTQQEMATEETEQEEIDINKNLQNVEFASTVWNGIVTYREMPELKDILKDMYEDDLTTPKGKTGKIITIDQKCSSKNGKYHVKTDLNIANYPNNLIDTIMSRYSDVDDKQGVAQALNMHLRIIYPEFLKYKTNHNLLNGTTDSEIEDYFNIIR